MRKHWVVNATTSLIGATATGGYCSRGKFAWWTRNVGSDPLSMHQWLSSNWAVVFSDAKLSLWSCHDVSGCCCKTYSNIWYLCVGVVLCKCILIVPKNLLFYHVVFLSLIVSSCQWADWYHVGVLSIIYGLSAQIVIHIDICRKSRKWWSLEDVQMLGFQNLMWYCPDLSLFCPALFCSVLTRSHQPLIASPSWGE